MVAITVGSKHATTLFPGFDGKAAGFCMVTLLQRVIHPR
jgi:hypothetical protein